MVSDGGAAQARIDALVRAMEMVVAGMDPVTRDVFVLHRLDGWPYARIARERGLGSDEVGRHLASAVATLDLGLRRLGL